MSVSGARPVEVADGAALRSAQRLEVRSRWLMVAPALAILLFAAVGPLAIMIVYSFLAPGPYGGVVWEFSTEAWFRVLFQRDIFDGTVSLADAHLSIFWRSVKLSLMTTALALALGFPTAYFIATQPPRARGLWLFLITIPFWTSYLLRVFAWKIVLGYNGVVNASLMELGIIAQPLEFLLYNVNSVVITLAHAWAPFAILPIFVSLEKIDRSLLEAATDLGDGPLRRFLRVTLPLSLPGVVAAALIVFIPTVGDYVTPHLVGGKNGLMIANMIQVQFGKANDWPLGAALAVSTMLIVTAASLLFVAFAKQLSTRFR